MVEVEPSKRYATRASDSARVVSFGLTLGFLLLSTATLAARSSFTPGYEGSIFESLPLTFFPLYFAASTIAIVLVFWARDRHIPAMLRTTTYVLLLSCSTVLVLLPALRGYFLYGRGDLLSHLGAINAVIRDQGVPDGNFYPHLHVLFASLSLTGGIDPGQLLLVSTPLFQALFAGYAFLAASRLADRKFAPLAFAICAFPILGLNHLLVTPAYLSYVFVLLAIWLSLARRNEASLGLTASFVIVLVVLPMVHLLTAAFLLFFFVAGTVLGRLSKRSRSPEVPARTGYSAPMILGVSWLAWFSSFSIWTRSVRRVAEWVSRGPDENPALTATLNLAARYGLGGEDLAILFAKVYGLLVVITIAVWLMSVRLTLRHGSSQPRLHAKAFVILGVLLGASFAANVSGASIADPFRPIVLGALFAVGSLGLLSELRRRKLSTVLLVTLVALTMVWTPFVAFPSPFTLAPNEQVNESELSSTTWFVQVGSASSVVVCHFGCYRFFEATGVLGARAHFRFVTPPDHYDFDPEWTAGQSILFVSHADRTLLVDVWGFSGKFTQSDFEHLEVRPDVNRLFDSGLNNVYLVMRIPAQ